MLEKVKSARRDTRSFISSECLHCVIIR